MHTHVTRLRGEQSKRRTERREGREREGGARLELFFHRVTWLLMNERLPKLALPLFFYLLKNFYYIHKKRVLNSLPNRTRNLFLSI
jgi:hypothetical protein